MGVETKLIDARKFPMRLDGGGEQMKDAAFSATIDRCDGIILIVPEYNHGYRGLLKHSFDVHRHRRRIVPRIALKK